MDLAHVREQFALDMKKASDAFNVVGACQNGEIARQDGRKVNWPSGRWESRIVEAEAKTGSRYVVVATRLGHFGQREGGPVLVSVVWPWQDCKVMQDNGFLDVSYVAEHLTDGRGYEARLHGGDAQALTMAIRLLLDREED